MNAEAEEKKIVFMDPDFEEKEFDGAFVTDGTDGLLEYVTQDSDPPDLHTEGNWEYYAWVRYPGASADPVP